MGEVYRAHDSRLNRDVALKVLPDGFASDPDRLARFRREAQVLASLNHPNIAAIYGLEELARSRIAHGAGAGTGRRADARRSPRARPAADRRSAADCAADRQRTRSGARAGVIHRDLKPANIKIRDDGTVKVLDFGLAKAFERDVASQASATLSPTLTSPAMTRVGLILGTAAYMAPEQARGKAVDKRADIWAFGVVLYEMLAGRRLFGGDDVSDTLALVLTKEPDWTALPPLTPASLRRLLRRCLEKDWTRRLADIADARLDVEEALQDLSSGPAASLVAPSERREPRWWRVAPWVVAGTALAGLAATFGSWAPWRDTPTPAPVRVEVALGTGAVLSAATPSLAMSSDGMTLAFVARPAGIFSTQNLMFVRRLDRLDAQVLAGTEGAAAPFFSPDGEWIAFFADGLLKKIPAIGGALVSICSVASPRGGWWGADNTIVFASSEGVSRVSAMGGQVERLTVVQKGGPVPSSPQILPNGRGVLYMEAVSSVDPNNSAVAVVKPLPSGDPKVVLRGGGMMPRYVETGHLAIVRAGTMFAVPFDLKSLEARGSPVPVADNITTITTIGAVAALSAKGLLVYQARGSASAAQGPIVWLDRSGATTPLRATPAVWGFPRFSPDGKRLALVIDDGRQMDVWVYEWERDILTRVTADPGQDIAPACTSPAPVRTPAGVCTGRRAPTRHGRRSRASVPPGARTRRCAGAVRFDGVSRAAVIRALDRVDPALGAFIELDPDAALRAADQAPDGPLSGLVVAVKDLVDTGGMRTTYGSPRFADHVPAADAPLVAGLRAQGATVLGKTNLNEFAYGVSGLNPHFGQALTPADGTRTAGWLQLGLGGGRRRLRVRLAIGTDTSGSIRIPAACCGIYGFKAAHGALPLQGVLSAGPELRHRRVPRRRASRTSSSCSASRTFPRSRTCAWGGWASTSRCPTCPPRTGRCSARRRGTSTGRRSSATRRATAPICAGSCVAHSATWPRPSRRSRRSAHATSRRPRASTCSSARCSTARRRRSRRRAPTTSATSYLRRHRLLRHTPVFDQLGGPALAVPTADGPRQVAGRPGTEAALLAVARDIGLR